MGAGHSPQRMGRNLARLDRETGLGRKFAAGGRCGGPAFVWPRLKSDDGACRDIISLFAGKLAAQLGVQHLG